MALDDAVPLGRSPRYPRHPLPVAVSYARKFYDEAHKAVIDVNTAYRVMGFAGKSGSSSTALGAMRQFGLVDNAKEGVRISELALRILEPLSSEESMDALRASARRPPVFDAIYAHFNSNLPRSDEPIRAHLIRQMEFSKSGADECITSLRETATYLVQAAPLPSEPTAAAVVEPPAPLRGNPATSTVTTTALTDVRHGLMRVLLTKECTAELAFIGPLSVLALDRLIKHIDLLRDAWTD